MKYYWDLTLYKKILVGLVPSFGARHDISVSPLLQEDIECILHFSTTLNYLSLNQHIEPNSFKFRGEVFEIKSTWLALCYVHYSRRALSTLYSDWETIILSFNQNSLIAYFFKNEMNVHLDKIICNCETDYMYTALCTKAIDVIPVVEFQAATPHKNIFIFFSHLKIFDYLILKIFSRNSTTIITLLLHHLPLLYPPRFEMQQLQIILMIWFLFLHFSLNHHLPRKRMYITKNHTLINIASKKNAQSNYYL